MSLLHLLKSRQLNSETVTSETENAVKHQDTNVGSNKPTESPEIKITVAVNQSNIGNTKYLTHVHTHLHTSTF